MMKHDVRTVRCLREGGDDQLVEDLDSAPWTSRSLRGCGQSVELLIFGEIVWYTVLYTDRPFWKSHTVYTCIHCRCYAYMDYQYIGLVM